MAIHLDKTVSIILAVFILFLAILVLAKPFESIRNAIVNSDIGNFFGLNDEKAQNQASSLFDDLISKLERCKKSANSECLCVEGKIVFPKDYYLILDNDNSKNLEVILKTNTDAKLKDYTLNSVNGCYITRGNLAQNMDRNENEFGRALKIIFGSKNNFLYKQKRHDVDVSLIFYKEKSDTQTRICVVDKDVAKILKTKPLC